MSSELLVEDVIDAETRAKGRAERPARKAAKAQERAAQTAAAAAAQRTSAETRTAAAALTALRAQEVEDAAAERARTKLEAQRSERAETKLKKKVERTETAVAKRLAVTKKHRAQRLAKAARIQPTAVLKGETEPGSAPGAAQETLLDSCASTTFLTTASARAAQLEGNVRVKVSDAQGKLITARGGGALFGKIKDKAGEWHKEQVAANA